MTAVCSAVNFRDVVSWKADTDKDSLACNTFQIFPPLQETFMTCLTHTSANARLHKDKIPDIDQV